MTYKQLIELVNEYVKAMSAATLRRMGPNSSMTISDEAYRMYAEMASLRGAIDDLAHVATWRNRDIALEAVVERMQATIYEHGEQIANSLPEEVVS